jgi:hypothetical protein
MQETNVEYYNNKICVILDFIEKIIPNEYWLFSIREEVECCESQVALECLCDNVFEYDIPLTHEIYVNLMEVCVFFNVHEKYWKNIKPE